MAQNLDPTVERESRIRRKARRMTRNLGLALLTAILTSVLLPSILTLPSAIAQQPAQTILPSILTLPGAIAQQSIQTTQTQSSATTLMQLGRERYENEQFLAAAQALQQAAEIYAHGGDALRQAQALSLQALAWQKLSKRDLAQAAIDKSVSLLDAIQQQTPEMSRIRAQALNAQGHLQLAWGQADRAVESWTTAEAAYRQAQFPSGMLGIQINQAQALQSLGLYRRAERLLDQLEGELRAEPSQLNGTIRAKGLLNLGNVLRLGGEVERARDILMEGLAIARDLQLAGDEGQALLGLGNTERVMAKRAEAIRDEAAHTQHIQTALKHYQDAQEITPAEMTRVQAQLNQIGLLVETGQLEKAQGLRSRLLQKLPRLPASRAALYARINLAQRSMEIALSEAPAIGERLAIAVQQARALKDRRVEAYALGTLGMLYEKMGDVLNAKTTTKVALTIAQAIRAPDIAYQWQWQMGRLLQAETQAEKSTLTPAMPEAIAYYTAAVETLNGLRSDLAALNPDIQFSFRESVEPVYRQLVDLLLGEEKPSIMRLKQARTVMEGLQLAEIDNFFRDACAKPEAVDIDTIDQTAAIVYPILLKDRLAVILKLPGVDNLRYYSTRETSEEQIDTAVKQLLSKLKRRSIPPGRLKTDSQRFYKWLIEPFAADLEKQVNREQSAIKTLVFVLDGSLRNVPIASLYDGERYLIERYAIAVTPGLQLLAPRTLQPDKLRVLLAGATEAPSFVDAGLGSLNNVAFEISGVKEQLDRSTSLEDEAFRQAMIRAQVKASPFNVVHLATHGNFSSNPEQTFLLDWNSRISANDIDTLFQAGAPSQERAIELLVLSACETAAGDKRAALGLAGIAIRAEVRSTLATLWQVNDASTAEFMIRFYQQLSSGRITKAEALRNAQLAFLKDYPDTDYNRPFHWAPFTLVGNWL